MRAYHTEHYFAEVVVQEKKLSSKIFSSLEPMFQNTIKSKHSFRGYFDLCSALMAIEEWGLFSVPHTNCDTGHPFKMIKTLRKNILTNRWLTNPTSYFKVKLEALNRYGQNLWEMEFFTNTCMSADPLEWLADDHVLYQTGLNLSVRYDMCLK